MSRTKSEVRFESENEGGARLQYRLLGPVEVLRDDEPVDLGVFKQRALLALLLINANEVVSTDRIIDELWGDDAGKDKQKALWPVVSRLRGALEPDREKRSDGSILLSRPPGYVLSVDPADIDATRFEALTVEGRGLLETDPAAASLVLSEALGLWRGHALEEFMYEAFAEAAVTRLEELRLAALEDRIDADLRTGRARELIGELESLVRQHPARERMTGHLMLALHLSGRQGDALRAFGTYRTHMSEELGLDPSAEISRLEERIVLDDPDLRQVGAVRSLAGRPEPGLAVRGYELREQIGSGAMGNVYRAFQPAVGREVAIKVIRPELANDPSFIRHFEAEARLIARLEHPQIVPVFDYWREPDSAYLVTRRFERGSLRDLTSAGGLTPEAATSVVTQVGTALAAAHRQGVAHGDLKPENVLIDGDGNAYLADFGMSWSNGGAEGFVAPEQQSSAETTPQADLFSLGRLAEYAFRGTGVDISSVVAEATATRPTDRFRDVEAFVVALADAVGATPAALSAEVVNPYRGLHAFDESDAERFFGRERLVERLLARLGHRGPQGRFVAVVGPSGSGKSSVVRAGLIPALRGAAVAGSERWFIATMIPGRHPFEALEESLRSIAVEPPPDLLEKLATDGIASAVAAVIADPSAQLVLVIDQLEELFSLAAPHEADRFMDAVAEAATDRHSSVKVIATLRADFYDHPLRHEAFGELVRLGTEVITPMNAQELEQAITGPAAGVGVAFESGLVSAIAADMAGQTTALPLLQYALTELFERRDGLTVTVAAYQELGGVSGALARRADGIHESLAPPDQRRLRDVLLRLVTLNEGGADTRRRALVSELDSPGQADAGTVLDAFGRHRLLSFDRDPVTRSPTVEIAHEALLTEWTRLRGWIDDARSDLQAERQLAAAVDEWHDSGQEPDFLLTGARLARYAGWSERSPVPLMAQERDFLSVSAVADAAELETERHRVKRLRRLVTGVGVALVLALIAGGIALQQQRRADDEAQRAEEEAQRANENADRAEAAAADAVAQTEAAVLAARDAELATLISRSAAVGEDEADLALLLALEAHARRPGPTTEQAILGALTGTNVGRRVASRPALVDDCTGATGFTHTPDGLVVETATLEGELTLRNPATGEVLHRVDSPGPCAQGAASPEAGAAQSLDGRTIWLGPDLDVVFELEQPEDSTGIQRSIATALPRHVLVFAQATESADALALVVDAQTGRQIGEPIAGNEGQFFVEWSARASPDRSRFAMGFTTDDFEAGELVVADAATAGLVSRIALPECCPTITWDPTTDHVVLGFQSGLIWSVDPDAGTVVTEIQLDLVRGPAAIGVEPEGTLIVVTGARLLRVDRTAGVVAELLELRNVRDGYVGSDGFVVILDAEGQLEIFDPRAGALVREIEVDNRDRVGFDAGFAGLMTGGNGQVWTDAAVIDLDSGERFEVALTLPNGDAFGPGVVWPAPDGVWAVSPDHVLARWQGGELIESISLGSDDGVTSVLYGGGPKPAGSRWGDLYAVPGLRADGTTEVTLARMEPGDAEVLMIIDSPDARWAHPTPDGGLYVHASESSAVAGVLRVYDAAGELIDEIATGALDPYAFSLDPTGSKLAFGDLGGLLVDDGFTGAPPQILILDTASGRVDVVPQDGVVSTISFNGAGTQMVLSMFDGTVRLWDVEAGGVPTIVWTGSGTFDSEPGWYDAATDSIWTIAGGRLLNIPLDPNSWVELACDVVGRDLTQEEWDRFVPGDEPLRAACA